MTNILIAALLAPLVGGQTAERIQYLVPSSYSAKADRPISFELGFAPSTVDAATICGRDTRRNFEGDLAEFGLDGHEAALCAIVFKKSTVSNSASLLKPWGIVASGTANVIQTASSAIAGESDSSVIMNRLGLPTELRLMTSPLHAAGADVALRFYGLDEMVEAGAPVLATYGGSGKPQRLTTDRAGMVNLKNVAAGVWKVAAAQMHGSNVYIASITFEVSK
ncbi:MAG: hypothetical protein ABL949_04580 [Fimbriimonadaceae bacterium]